MLVWMGGIYNGGVRLWSWVAHDVGSDGVATRDRRPPSAVLHCQHVLVSGAVDDVVLHLSQLGTVNGFKRVVVFFLWEVLEFFSAVSLAGVVGVAKDGEGRVYPVLLFGVAFSGADIALTLVVEQAFHEFMVVGVVFEDR